MYKIFKQANYMKEMVALRHDGYDAFIDYMKGWAIMGVVLNMKL